MLGSNKYSLPFADAATIVRANQKDNYYISTLNSQLQNALRIIKGQRFINTYPEEITTAGKTLYYLVTTVFGARTLGEEYVDILYVNRSGKRFPKPFKRLLFAGSFIILPYFVSKIARKLKSQGDTTESWITRILSSYSRLLDTIMNIHVAIFYFEGSFYSLSKRILGMRYAFGHNRDQRSSQTDNNYSVLGGIILVQMMMKLLIKLNQYSSAKLKEKNSNLIQGESQQAYSSFTRLEQLEKINLLMNENEKAAKRFMIDLSDPSQLPYIPSDSRNCMLCLSPMLNPSAANCGHFFCWNCIVDWVREHPECPLCRQVCLEQNLLPLQ